MGPATSSIERIRDLVDAGLDVARLNFSHGTHDDHAQMFSRVREVSVETGKAVGILADLQGPKIRLGTFGDGPVLWDTGETVRITVDDVVGNHDRVGTTYAQLARDAQVGDRLLVDDGKVGLVVTGIEGNDVVCMVTEGGPLHSTYLLSLYIYEQSFKLFNLGYGTALSWVLFALVAVLSAVAFYSSKYWVYYAGEKEGK